MEPIVEEMIGSCRKRYESWRNKFQLLHLSDTCHRSLSHAKLRYDLRFLRLFQRVINQAFRFYINLHVL